MKTIKKAAEYALRGVRWALVELAAGVTYLADLAQAAANKLSEDA